MLKAVKFSYDQENFFEIDFNSVLVSYQGGHIADCTMHEASAWNKIIFKLNEFFFQNNISYALV